MLVEAGDWEAVLSACEEAARAVMDQEFDRAFFLDGAALAAQELGRAGLAERLEAAWRAAPTMVRLRRWLGAASSRSELLDFAVVALAVCPPRFSRQSAFLNLLSGRFIPAATLLSEAPGLGWSLSDHPRHLLFTALCRLLGGGSSGFFRTVPTLSKRHAQEDEPWIGEGAVDRPRIPSPSVEALIERAGVDRIPSPLERGMVIEALRTAAEKRLAGIVESNRRSHYSHGAWLAVACVAVDESQDSLAWLAHVRESYRRRSALQKEFQVFLATLTTRPG